MVEKNFLTCLQAPTETAPVSQCPEMKEPLHCGTCIETLLPLLNDQVLQLGKTEIVLMGTPTASQRQALQFFETWGCTIRTGTASNNTAFIFFCSANPLTGSVQQPPAETDTLIYQDVTHTYGWFPLHAHTNAITVLKMGTPHLYLASTTLPNYSLRTDIPPIENLQSLHATREQHVFSLANALECLSDKLSSLDLTIIPTALPNHLLFTSKHPGELLSYFLYQEGLHTTLGGNEYPLLPEALIQEGIDPHQAHRAVALSFTTQEIDTSEIASRVSKVLNKIP